MVAKEPGHQGELEAAVKTIAQGRPDVSAYLWLLTRVLSTIAHAAAGALGTRSSLRPLIYQGHIFMHSSGESRREDAEPRSLVSLAPPLRGEDGVRGLSPRTVFAERAPHPKFAAQISTSPREGRGEVTHKALRAWLFEN
jgi:hypothetical protein